MTEEPMVYTVTEEDTDEMVTAGCTSGTLNCNLTTYNQLIAYCAQAGAYSPSTGGQIPPALCTQWGVYGS